MMMREVLVKHCAAAAAVAVLSIYSSSLIICWVSWSDKLISDLRPEVLLEYNRNTNKYGSIIGI